MTFAKELNNALSMSMNENGTRIAYFARKNERASYGDLKVYDIVNDTHTIVDSEVSISGGVSYVNDKLVYFKEVGLFGDFGKLYVDGKLVGENVLTNEGMWYNKDGTIIFKTKDGRMNFFDGENSYGFDGQTYTTKYLYNNKVAYVDNNKDLYIFNGKDAEKIDENVNEFFVVRAPSYKYE